MKSRGGSIVEGSASFKDFRGSKKTGGLNAIIGFLDVNFGVLGIFLIIFSVQIQLVQKQGAHRSNLLALLHVSDQTGSVSLVNLKDDKPVIIKAPLTAIRKTNSEFAKKLRVAVKKQGIILGEAPLVELIVTPDTFAVYTVWKSALSDEALQGQDNFFVQRWFATPVLSEEAALQKLQDWRNEGG